MYTGDINLRNLKITDEIKDRLRDYFPYIGTLQIPHHGSIDSYDKYILEENIQCAVVSYGYWNKYGHPSDRVIEDIVSRKIKLCEVTECQDSIAIQVTL